MVWESCCDLSVMCHGLLRNAAKFVNETQDALVLVKELRDNSSLL